MRAVIICGGSISDYSLISSRILPGDTVICADSGYDHALRMGLSPEAVVGDMDSVSAVPGCSILRYPSQKDETDTELALAFARERGFNEFLFLGATGTRLDHTLSNIFMLANCLIRGENAKLADEHNVVTVIDDFVSLNEEKGALVSLLPLTEKCEGVTTRHLAYPLEGAVLYRGSGRGVSNVMLESTAEVSVSSGLLIVTVSSD